MKIFWLLLLQTFMIRKLVFQDQQRHVEKMITILLVDGDGYITGVMTDYMEAIAENETKNGSVDVYGDESMLSQTKDIAIFANSVKPN